MYINVHTFSFVYVVTGDANFTMERTNLVVAGFSQPSVSRTLIEFPGNTEKGLSQRFLCIFPKPPYAHFCTLEPINESFTEQVGKFLKSLNTTNMLRASVNSTLEYPSTYNRHDHTCAMKYCEFRNINALLLFLVN